MALDPATMAEKRSLPPGATLNTDFAEIRFDELARSMGAHGERVTRARELRPALERSIASRKPAVVHVDVDPVTHLWAPGLDIFKKMHLEPGA
jgi:acetolactate synthase-1/2/3 large subunit